jgi:hypothetical protein
MLPEAVTVELGQSMIASLAKNRQDHADIVAGFDRFPNEVMTEICMLQDLQAFLIDNRANINLECDIHERENVMERAGSRLYGGENEVPSSGNG